MSTFSSWRICTAGENALPTWAMAGKLCKDQSKSTKMATDQARRPVQSTGSATSSPMIDLILHHKCIMRGIACSLSTLEMTQSREQQQNNNSEPVNLRCGEAAIASKTARMIKLRLHKKAARLQNKDIDKTKHYNSTARRIELGLCYENMHAKFEKSADMSRARATATQTKQSPR